MAERQSFWEVAASKSTGDDSCYKRIIARFDRADNATVFRDMKAHANPNYVYEVRMVQRARL